MVEIYYSYVFQCCINCMHDGTTVNDELERTWEEAVMVSAFHCEASSYSAPISEPAEDHQITQVE
jgi:hypothetical protein